VEKYYFTPLSGAEKTSHSSFIKKKPTINFNSRHRWSWVSPELVLVLITYLEGFHHRDPRKSFLRIRCLTVKSLLKSVIYLVCPQPSYEAHFLSEAGLIFSCGLLKLNCWHH